MHKNKYFVVLKKLTNIIKLIVFLGIGFFFVWIFVRKLTPEQIDEIFVSVRNADYRWLLLSFFIGIMSHVARAWRSVLLLRPMGYSVGFRNSFFAVMVGYLANLAVPRLGEVLRCSFLLKYNNIPFQKSFGTIITERAIDLLIFVILMTAGLLLEYERLFGYVERMVIVPLQDKAETALGNIFLYILAGIGVLVLMFFIVYWRKLNQLSIFKKFKSLAWGFVEGITSVARVEKPFLFVFLTLSIWLSYFLMTYVAFFAFEELSDLPALAAFSCLNFGTIAFMLVQGGIGIYPAIIAETLSLYDAPVTIAYAAGWVGWSIQTIMIIILGLFSVIFASLTTSKNGKPSEHNK